MRTLSLVLVALAVAGTSAAQRRARIGPTVSSISIENGSGSSNAFTSFGGSLALLSGDDGEFGLGVSRYGDLTNNSCVRQMTFIGLESNYYPVGAKGVAPYASTAVGLARVLDQDPTLALLGCNTGAQTTNELGLGFGLGVRFNFGKQTAALIEGRFFQVPNSAIKALEGRANISFAFGSPSKKSQLLNGTLGPAVGVLVPLSGALEDAGAPSASASVAIKRKPDRSACRSITRRCVCGPGARAAVTPMRFYLPPDTSRPSTPRGDACMRCSESCSLVSRKLASIAASPRALTAGSAPTYTRVRP